ncbi:PhoX family protein [Marinomonas sp. RS-M-Aa-14]|uniref:PhoX family protein n=1 Tax=Marinomonas sp. RS-M-Aa-14 TaxID=3241169 RepID=UPI00390C911B
MIIEQKQNLSFDELDELVRPAPEVVEFEEVAHRMVSRRGFLSGGAAVGASAFVMGSTTLAAGKAFAAAEASESRLAFSMVKANTLDTITVPEGYKWEVVASWGDPLFSNAPAFDPMTGGTGASQELAFGDHNDGMAFFAKDGKQIMAINNEYTNEKTLHANRADGMPINADDVRKNKAAHGVSIVEVDQRGGKWGIVQDSPYNRRITADTEMDITGPARGHKWLQTSEDPKGVVAKGTWNNCGNGQTPWGTYLTCEENFNGYFSASKDFNMPEAFKRYGVSTEGRYNWALSDDRFNLDKEPNEPNRFGYIVEIDPLDPTSRPKKRTALGRFKHENAELTIAANGHVVVYLGDDERGEFLYRFVSKHKYLAGGNNRDLLEEGTLYVAKFHDNNRGEWLALTPKTTGMTDAEIAIHTRMAASKVGATTMDRPEWVAAHPHKAEVYCSLTNNKNRGVKPNAGGDETPATGPNPRVKNDFGQIVRWMPMNEDHTSVEFKWDLFVLAGNPAVYTDANAGSKNINQDNMFNSPDGLKFDSKGLLWIQTDGNYSNEKGFQGQGNNQMLVGDPETGEIRRFLVGPKECEITGIAWNASKTTMFISVQHPGEDGNSNWPNGGQSVPRSSVVAISREDGAVIG